MNNPENMEIENKHDIKENSENMPSTARDIEDSASSSSGNKNIFYGWNKEEKFNLYMTLKKKGYKDVKVIQKHIPTKTLPEIEETIKNCQKEANERLKHNKKQLKNKQAKTKSLASWAKLLTDNLSTSELQTETASVMRLIADLDDIPPAELTGNVDFRKVYHQIADAMEGKKPTDHVVAQVLHGCVSNVALLSKQFKSKETLQQILNQIKIKDKSLALFQQPTEDFEQGIIHSFVSHEKYNPLGLSEEDLLLHEPDN